MAIGVNQYPILDSPLKIADSLYKFTLARQAKANAVKQEELNQNVARENLADILHKEITNKYLPREKESEIGLRGAQTGLYGEQRKKYEYERTHGGYKNEYEQLVDFIKQANQNGLSQTSSSDQVNQSERMVPTSGYTPSDQQQQLVNNISQKLGMEQPSVSGYQSNSSQAPQQNQMQGNIPGTDISIKDALNAVLKNKFHIPNTAASDPNTVAYHEAQIALGKRNADLRERAQNAADFDRLPATAKAADVSVVAPMVGGYTPAAKLLRNGKTPEEVAKDKGYDPNDRATWPPAAPPPTTPVITQLQKANMARNARDAIHERITESLGYYPQKVLGYNPKMIVDLIQGKNVEQAGKTLAAVFMNNEENFMLARGMGAQAGLGMLRMMNDKSLAQLGVPGWLQSKELLESFRKEVKNYNNILVGNENATLNTMYMMQNPAKFGLTESQAAPAQQSGLDAQIADLDRQIAELGG